MIRERGLGFYTLSKPPKNHGFHYFFYGQVQLLYSGVVVCFLPTTGQSLMSAAFQGCLLFAHHSPIYIEF